MYKTVLTLAIVAASALAADQAGTRPVPDDVQRAIQWERHKEAAAARQARKEAKKPTVTYKNDADRSAERSAPDPGEPSVRKDKDQKK